MLILPADSIKTYDRNDHPGTVIGIRAVYRTKQLGPCEDCGDITGRIIDYLGTLTYNCGQTEKHISKRK